MNISENFGSSWITRTMVAFVQNLYYRWSKDFLEAGKKRLAGDTARAATSEEVKDLRRMRPFDRDLIRGRHYGQRSREPR